MTLRDSTQKQMNGERPGRLPGVFAVALLCVLGLQPIYLISLAVTDYVAPQERRLAHLIEFPPLPPPGDDTTECVALTIGLQPNVVGFNNAILAPRALYGQWPCDALPALADHRAGITWSDYARYWHGYRVVLNPLAAWLDMHTVRFIMLAALIAALTWLVVEIRKLVGYPASVAFAVPTIVLTDLWQMWKFTENALATVIIFSGAALFAGKLRNGNTPIVAAAIMGSIFNYVDFLTNSLLKNSERM